jgi:hypothetical protein
MIVKGQKFICKKSLDFDNFFKVGNIYELIYVDNEKEIIEVCLKFDGISKMIPLNKIKENFNPIKLSKK